MSETKPVKCLVVDDEPLALQLIASYISRCANLELMHYTSNPVEALDWINAKKVDLIFVDIQMPELSGINLLKIAGNTCKSVLVTAHKQYALEGYEHNVIDYLLKPVTFERFLSCVQKINERFQPANLEVTSPDSNIDFLFVKTEHKLRRINFSEILYLEGLRDYVAIHTLTGKILSLESMRSFENRMPQGKFIRIHKSYIISISKIEHIEKNAVFINKIQVPIGQLYKANLLKATGLL
jgi:two-component system LytT family response regulator